VAAIANATIKLCIQMLCLFHYGSIRGEELVTYGSNNKLLKKNSVHGVAYCVSVRASLPVRMIRVESQGPAKTVRPNKRNCNSRTGAEFIFQIKHAFNGPTRDELMGEWRRLHNEELHDSTPNQMLCG